jgi:GNAT superfamily N-acetyltransferase
MEARPATPGDADEIVRLAQLMFASMGMDLADSTWEQSGRRHVCDRLGADLAVFVVDHRSRDGRLVASAAGTIARRLPTPLNADGRAGYVQWVCTDADQRGRGLGRRVMTALLGWYEANGVMAVELHATPMAEPMYRAMGFDHSGPPALRRRSPPRPQPT